MIRRKNTVPKGDWQITCDTSGFLVPASETVKQWNGLIVWRKYWDKKPGICFVRAEKERITPPVVRPYGDDSVHPVAEYHNYGG